MTKVLQSLVVAAALLTAGFFHAANAEAQPQGLRVGANLIVERVSEIDSRELWHLGIPKHAFSSMGKPPGGAVGMWTYGSESAPHEAGWFAVCLVLDGFGDVAETPVALRVWSKTQVTPTIVEQPPEAGRAVSFEIAIGQDRFVLSHTPSGTVFVNDQAMGEIR